MYTQDLNNAFMYESERRKDELAAAQESCRARQALGERPARHHHLVADLFNRALKAMTPVRKRQHVVNLVPTK